MNLKSNVVRVYGVGLTVLALYLNFAHIQQASSNDPRPSINSQQAILSEDELKSSDYNFYFLVQENLSGRLARVWDLRTMKPIVDWPFLQAYRTPGDKEKLIMYDGKNAQQYGLDGSPDQSLSLPGYLSANLNQILYSQNNDLWIADIDWANDRLVNQRQVTQVGVFKPSTKLWYWYENVAVVGGYRVDLQSGEVVETPTGWFKLSDRLSPERRYVIVTGKQREIGVYDVVSNTVKWLGFGRNIRAHLWLSKDRFVLDENNEHILHFNIHSENETFIRAPGQDRANPNAVLPTYSGKASLLGASPSGRYFFTLGNIRNERGAISIFRDALILVDTDTWEATGVTVDGRRYQWATDRYFFYAREGAIAERGTWVYNTQTGEATKVSSYLFTEMVVFPESNLAVFTANNILWRVRLDGSELKEVATGNFTIKPFLAKTQ